MQASKQRQPCAVSQSDAGDVHMNIVLMMEHVSHAIILFIVHPDDDMLAN